MGQSPAARIQTNIDVPEGRKVVVGKTAFPSADKAVILVLTAKVIDGGAGDRPDQILA